MPPHPLTIHALGKLREMYATECHWVERLPDLAAAAPSEKQASDYLTLLAETEAKIQRLRQLFEAIGEDPILTAGAETETA